MKKAFILILAAIFLASSVPAFSEDCKGPTGGEMMFDIVLTRPLGLAAIVLGTAVFVVGLPFTLPTGSVGVSARRLIGEPVKYTFQRPVGEITEGPCGTDY
ncbi:MAG: hypothetical protein HY893_06225 [Deltaproteobacteria bacterium]|nr:hypothetical protein [Deltaproteobacteria bacterium]